jgi:hypothetical protein
MSWFESVHSTYSDMLFSPVFFCTMGYGVIYLISGSVAAIAVTGDRYFTKASVVLGEMLCAFPLHQNTLTIPQGQ